MGARLVQVLVVGALAVFLATPAQGAASGYLVGLGGGGGTWVYVHYR